MSLEELMAIAIIACWLSTGAPQALSLHGQGVEYPVKLAFLYNFTKFIDWPPRSYRDPGAPLAICIVGRDPFNPDIEGDLRTRIVGRHPVQVLTLKPTDTLSVCHMVFIPATENGQASKIVRDLSGSSTLTVGETEGFRRTGRDHQLDGRGQQSSF